MDRSKLIFAPLPAVSLVALERRHPDWLCLFVCLSACMSVCLVWFSLILLARSSSTRLIHVTGISADLSAFRCISFVAAAAAVAASRQAFTFDQTNGNLRQNLCKYAQRSAQSGANASQPGLLQHPTSSAASFVSEGLSFGWKSKSKSESESESRSRRAHVAYTIIISCSQFGGPAK